jgi:hypothetical protein
LTTLFAAAIIEEGVCGMVDITSDFGKKPLAIRFETKKIRLTHEKTEAMVSSDEYPSTVAKVSKSYY